MLTKEQKQAIIQAAIYAPSADNSQPFLHEWTNDTLRLWIDESRSGKASDNRYVLSDIALGAVIENILLTAESLGFQNKISYLHDEKKHPLYIASIEFNSLSDETIKDVSIELSAAIPKRSTNRRFPFKGKLSDNNIEKMDDAAKINGCSIQWFTNKKSIKTVLPVIQKAESIRFKSKVLHQELFSTINFDDENIAEGMHISVLAIEKIAQPFFKLMHNWSVMNLVNKIGGAYLLGLRSVRIPISMSPALALIKIKSNARLDVIKGGQALQRVWLQATSQGLSIQPYAAPGIFSLGYIDCESAHKSALQEISEQMTQIISNDGYGLMFLRLGYSTPNKHRTMRRHMDSFKKK